MFCIDDMESCIQEWFAYALSPVEVAKTYHVILQETEKQLDFMMQERTKSEMDHDLVEASMSMRATGIIRRVDDFGRVAIPKEIRRRAEIEKGTPMEIFYDPDGTVVLKRYIPKSERED